jgi:chromosome segregation ATPase
MNAPEKPTHPDQADLTSIANEIARAETKLQELESEIQEIGQPAAEDLQKRLSALRTEEHALKRNLHELIGKEGADDGKRLDSIRKLLDHIRNEQKSLSKDAGFLNQANLTSPELAMRAGSKIADLVTRGLKRVVGDHQLLGESAFVNHTHEELSDPPSQKNHPDHPRRP